MFLSRKCLPLTFLILAFAFCVSMNVNVSAEEAAVGKTSQAWLLRSLEAFYRVKGQKENPEESAHDIAEWVLVENDRMGQMLLLECLNQLPPELLYLTLNEKHIAWLIERLEDKNWKHKETVVEVLVKATHKKKGRKQAKWQAWWEKSQQTYKKNRNQHLKAAIKAGNFKPVQDVSGSEKKIKSLIPRQLKDFVEQISIGVDLVVCIDDTASMGGWVTSATSASEILFLVLHKLSPQMRAGYLTYKDEVNHTLGFTTEFSDVKKFLGNVRAGGGGSGREGVHEAMVYAAKHPEYDWRDDVYKSILLIGDARAKGAVRWAKAAKDLNENEDFHINTLCVKPDFVDGWEEVAFVGGGEAYCLSGDLSFVEQFVYSSTGAYRYEQLSELIHTMIPLLLAEHRVSKKKK